MKGILCAMALMAGAYGPGMNSYGGISSGSRFNQPTLPEEKKVLPGAFKGTIPKGCKITTIGVEVKWQGFLLTKYVDIIFGSEKAKQKAIIKAGFEIKEYLQYHQRYGALKPEDFKEFDIIEALPKEKDTTFDKFIEK
jgi:hypothetical protein